MTQDTLKNLERHYRQALGWHIKEMQKTGDIKHLRYIAEYEQKLRNLKELEGDQA